MTAERKEPAWVPRIAVEAPHLDQIREHGGLLGLRDEASLDAALNRAKQKWDHGENPDLSALAAAYGFGISSNHPFRDGNKRVAFLSVVMFLGLNGWTMVATEEDVVHAIRGLASGDLDEDQLADWIRTRVEELT